MSVTYTWSSGTSSSDFFLKNISDPQQYGTIVVCKQSKQVCIITETGHMVSLSYHMKLSEKDIRNLVDSLLVCPAWVFAKVLQILLSVEDLQQLLTRRLVKSETKGKIRDL